MHLKSSCMALPRWFVSEKLGIRGNDFCHCLRQAVSAGVAAGVHLAFDPQKVSFLDVGADVLGDASVGNDAVPFGFAFVAAVVPVDRFGRC